MNIKVNLLLGGLILLNLLACQNDSNSGDASQNSASTDVNPTALFSPISATQSGVDFSNNIVENEEKNYFNFEYIYNGAGVALGDLNNDGLVDIFFSGNEVENKLYKNKGDFKFEDVTKFAAVKGSEWRSGVSMADVNNDGLLDIYVCRGGYKKDPAARKNLLYINRGDFRFKEQAAEFGLAESGYSIQSSFFDYDNDGDLDVYITNHPFEYDLPLEVRLDRRKNPGEQVRDKLYRNNGDNTFTEVAKEAGIVNYGHGLGVVTADVNQDGWIDVYVANDYKEPDFLYLNQGDGTFKERIKEATGHVSFYAMGVDVADINNDGLEDILTTEMLPFDYKRSKTNMASMNIQLFRGMLALGLHHQYMHNSLQLNQGNGRFSEISQMTGLAKTDWSWACLINDFDNDGQKDIFIANGYKRDVFDRDYKKNAEAKAKQQGGKLNLDQLYNIMPSTKIPNFIFKNEGNLTFSDKSQEWGISQAMLSMGGAVADLDNDGDLDLVLNNLDEPSVIFKNNAEKLGNNYLKIKFKGKSGNQLGLGTKVKIYTGDNIQYQELKTTRGYQSSVEPVLHFGLGKTAAVDKIEVAWQDGKTEVLSNITANQLLTIDYKNAGTAAAASTKVNPIFVDQTDSKISPPFVHKENKFDDYKKQILLPHSQSQGGPFTAVGDVNGDGLEDFYVGGAQQQAGQLYLQNNSGKFLNKKITAFEADKVHEDMGSLLFDADGDGDLDLYVTSGGAELEPKNPYYQDRLYLNTGKGNFTKATDALPQIFASTSCVTASDYDKDGDIDLFVGGRIFPDHYPYPTQSYIFRNDGGKFTDVAFANGQNIALAGMVTSAIWTDIDTDGDDDLLIVGEWMPLKVFKNNNGAFVEATAEFGLTQTVGWWNKVIETDYDGDGDMDYIVGNLGLNHKFHASPEKPFHIYGSDFDQNGSVDVVLAKYDKDTQVPVRGRECSSEQMPFVAQKFPTFGEFANASLSDILGEGMNQALHYEATMFESIILEKTPNGFVIKPLPRAAQIAPINGIVAADFTGDGKQDILTGGNMYGTEAETTRADASVGLLLKGGGTNLQPMTVAGSGFSIPYDVKDVKAIQIGKNGRQGVLVSSNNAALRLFTLHQ